jgi:molybdenum cofactor synthesis domain-containing protein
VAIQIAIFAIGDRYHSGQANAEGADVLEAICRKMGWEITHRQPLTDNDEQISSQLIQTADEGKADIIFTVDGVGVLPKDRAAEALYGVCEKWIPGLPELIRLKSYEKNPLISLYRGLAGVRGKTIIVNLPGTPVGVKDSMDALKTVLRQTVEQIKGVSVQ